MRSAVGVPPKPSARHVSPSAGGDAANPPGPARAAQAWSRDSAVRAQAGPGCRLVERPRSGGGPAELPIVEPIRRRRRSGPPGGRASAAQCVGRVTLQTGPGWARQPDRRADSVRERPRAEPPIVEPSPGPARARGRSAEVQAASRGHVPRPRRRAPVERRGCGPARGAGPRRPGHRRTEGTKTSHSTNTENLLDAPLGPRSVDAPPGSRSEPSAARGEERAKPAAAEASWPAGPGSQRPATTWSGGPASACVETATAVGAARLARGQVSSGRLDDGG
jgi:hypothetical protein